MATFGKAAFDTATYASSRPIYPRQLFDFIFKYHEKTPGARWDTAIDLGCGTGQATTELTPFRRVIGVDPSKKMLEGAREHTAALGLDKLNKFEFVQGAAEDLSFLPQHSADLLISAQAGHWFDYGRMWPAAARALRPGGSAAFWVYSEFRLSHHPAVTPLITEYAQGSDPSTSLGPHFQRPGRTVLERHLVDVPTAEDVVPGAFVDWQRVYFTGTHYPELPGALPVILRQRMSWLGLLGYLRTFSSLLTYHEHYPEDLKREDGDIAVRFWRALKAGAEADGAGTRDDDNVDVEWPIAMIMVKRK